MKYLTSLCLLIHVAASGQDSFTFVNLPGSAQEAAVGGIAITDLRGDIGVAGKNPALLDSVKSSSAQFLYNPFLGGINRFNASYHLGTQKIGTFNLGVTYTGYGDFTARDDIGTGLGEFSARDYVVFVGKNHRMGPFSLGVNLKFAGSHIDTYAATMLLFDLGGIYRHPSQQFVVGMTFQNMGFVLSDYSGYQDLRAPFNITVGTTFKPQYMPFRFTITVSDLARTGDPYVQNTFDPPNEVDKILRYVNLGGALVIGRNIEILLGYNHRLRQELRLSQGAYGSGFSYGFLLAIKNYEFRLSRMKLHAAGGSTFLSVATNFQAAKNIF